MTRNIFALLALLLLAVSTAQAETSSEQTGWIKAFNGKNLDGWVALENKDGWTVEDGLLVGRGDRSHLFFDGHEFTDLEFKAEVKLSKSGNSGMYFRTKKELGWPSGYEAQVNNSSPDPRKTGSLYNFVDVRDQLVEDDTWWTQHIIAKGNHIVIKVNGKTVVDFVDEKNTFKKGFIALQQHDPGSTVHYRNIMVRPLDTSK